MVNTLWQISLLLEDSDNTFEFADTENSTIHEKDFSISCIELKSVQLVLLH